MSNVLGIDIGGTGIKGALVDTTTGKLTAERHRIPTPHPATPKAVATVVGEVAKFFGWEAVAGSVPERRAGSVPERRAGATFPAVIKDGVAYTAANVDKSWIGTDAGKLFSDAIGAPVTVLNDADAAGVAEMEFGVGKGVGGVVIMVTLGTGIGSALFLDGALVPNTELGHLKMGKKDAERIAAESVREEQHLSWKEWAVRLDSYFVLLEALFSPDLIIVGGGVSKKSDKFLPRISTRAKIVPAQLLNEAGIVGAALAAAKVSGADH
jgi:polyphosphate glucokinase